MTDTDTPFPPVSRYDAIYLTKPEQDFVFCHLTGLNCQPLRA